MFGGGCGGGIGMIATGDPNLTIRTSFLSSSQYPASLNNALSNLEFGLDRSSSDFVFSLPTKTADYDIRASANDIVQLKPDDLFTNISLTKENRSESISFRLCKARCVKDLLENNSLVPFLESDLKKILIEYSSPNIAKPFHVGHLRSTILGNYIANINEFIGNGTKRINYLGDWGTQFGFSQLGLDLLNIGEEKLRNDPIRILYEAYVHANKLAETDPTIAERARSIFRQLELGEGSDFQKWELLREFTIDELRHTYERLGVRFDEYNWESMYNIKNISKVISEMKSKKLLFKDTENKEVVAINEKRNVTLLKSDGSTLYLTRDIAAAIDRFDRHNFDAMYYVVENGQTDHFSCLVTILQKMGYTWADRLNHVKFGRIRGMSTRKGTAVFLKDFLDETRAVMREKQIRSPTTKVPVDLSDETSDVLGTSAVIVNDFRQRRLRDYEFDWDRALDIKGDTGVKLQYAHCRLTSLEQNSGATLPSECDPSLLKETVVDQILNEIGRFDETVLRSHQALEPHVVVNYLFGLSNAINKGLKVLRVKGEPNDVASQRLLLFHSAKKVLAKGMQLLGLRPLDRM